MSRVLRAQPANPTVANPPTNGHPANGQHSASDFVDQIKLLAALRGVRAGDFGVRLPLDWIGLPGNIAEAFNEVVELNQRLARQFDDLTQSHAKVRAQLTDLTDMATDRDRVLNAVARGDLSQRVALDVDGRPLEGAFLRSGQGGKSIIPTSAAGPRCLAPTAAGKPSPIPSTPWPPTSPVRSATSPKSPPRSRPAICPR